MLLLKWVLIIGVLECGQCKGVSLVEEEQRNGNRVIEGRKSRQ